MFIFTIIGIMAAGVLVGRLLRRRDCSGVNRVVTVLIWILLFLLGIQVGTNRRIIENLHTLGIEALILTLLAVAFCVLCSWVLWLFVSPQAKKGRKS